MDPIIHNIDPYIFRIGDGFGVRWYSLPYMCGMLFVFLSLRKAGREGSLPLNDELAESFVLLGVVSALLGARFFHVFVFEFDRYGMNPLAWIAVWRGGLAFHGGLVGVILAVAWFSHRHGIGFYRLIDRITVPILLALSLGRIANFINAEMYGTPYAGPFCVDYSQSEYMAAPPDGCRHPTQLYESAKNVMLAGLLLGVRERINPRPGVLFWSFVCLYGWIRFGLMFLRSEELAWGGFTLSQIFSGLMGIVGTLMLVQVLMTKGGRESPVREGAPGATG